LKPFLAAVGSSLAEESPWKAEGRDLNQAAEPPVREADQWGNREVPLDVDEAEGGI
jgi:hypothetical protein